jgi:ribosome recycling factor
LSEERRKDLTKVAKRMSEETRVAIRNIRRESNDHIKTLQKGSKITEDERDQALDQIQKETDAYIGKVDDAFTAKEKEMMAV